MRGTSMCMLLKIWNILCVSVLLVTLTTSADAQTTRPSTPLETSLKDLTTSENSSSFENYVDHQAKLEVQIALRLYDEFDDYRAVTALKRYAIMAQNPEATFLSSMMIGQIYHRNNKPDLSALAFETAVKSTSDPATKTFAYLMALQEICLPLSYYVECRKRLDELAEQPMTDTQRELVSYQLLYTDVVLRSPYVTNARTTMFRSVDLQAKAATLIAQDEAFDDLPTKSPWVSGILSGVIPGAGQIYNGRPWEALASFLVTGSFGAATYYSFVELENLPLGIISGLLTLGFYSGNIINAVTDSNRINAKLYRNFFEDLKTSHWPRIHFAIQGDAVSFGYRFDWPGPTYESQRRKKLNSFLPDKEKQ